MRSKGLRREINRILTSSKQARSAQCAPDLIFLLAICFSRTTQKKNTAKEAKCSMCISDMHSNHIYGTYVVFKSALCMFKCQYGRALFGICISKKIINLGYGGQISCVLCEQKNHRLAPRAARSACATRRRRFDRAAKPSSSESDPSSRARSFWNLRWAASFC